MHPVYVASDRTGYCLPWELIPNGDYQMRCKAGAVNGYRAELMMIVRQIYLQHLFVLFVVFICWFTCFFVCLSFCFFVCLSVCCLFVCPSVCLLCVCVCLFVFCLCLLDTMYGSFCQVRVLTCLLQPEIKAGVVILQASEDEDQLGHLLDASFDLLLSVDSLMKKRQPRPNISAVPSDYVGTYVSNDFGTEVRQWTSIE